MQDRNNRSHCSVAGEEIQESIKNSSKIISIPMRRILSCSSTVMMNLVESYIAGKT